MIKFFKILTIFGLLFIISFSSTINITANEIENELDYLLERKDQVEKGKTVLSLEIDSERNLVLASVTHKGLTIYDATNPNLTELSTIYLSSEHEIETSNGYAYVACLGLGIRVVNITDPTQPKSVGIFSEGSGAEGTFIEINEDLLFIGDWADGIEIVNISDPTNMSLVTSFHPTYEPSPLYLYGDYCYTNVLTGGGTGPPTSEGLSVIDISNLNNITELNFLSNYTGLAPSAHQGNYLFAGGREDGLTIFDVSDPINPNIVSQTSDGEGNALQVAIDGDFAYMTDEDDGLEVYNISNKENPKLIAEYDFDTIAIHLRIMNSLVYVSTTDGLSVLELKLNDSDDSKDTSSSVWSMMFAILSIGVFKRKFRSRIRNQK